MLAHCGRGDTVSLVSTYSTYKIGRIEEVRIEMSKGREKWDTKIVSLV